MITSGKRTREKRTREGAADTRSESFGRGLEWYRPKLEAEASREALAEIIHYKTIFYERIY